MPEHRVVVAFGADEASIVSQEREGANNFGDIVATRSVPR